LHPRLGANSPARALACEDSKKICGKIFEFLECFDPGLVKCLLVCHWPPATQISVVRDIVLNHIDILQRWKTPSSSSSAAKFQEEPDSGDGGTASEKDNQSGKEQVPGQVSQGSQEAGAKKEARPREKEEPDSVPHWVFLYMPEDRIVASSPDADLGTKLIEVVDRLKALPNGLRTGLRAKEQLLLTPYFPNHAWLLLKYAQ
ncbi:unnamed protein product, partial [Polarella glacialis]